MSHQMTIVCEVSKVLLLLLCILQGILIHLLDTIHQVVDIDGSICRYVGQAISLAVFKQHLLFLRLACLAGLSTLAAPDLGTTGTLCRTHIVRLTCLLLATAIHAALSQEVDAMIVGLIVVRLNLSQMRLGILIVIVASL